MNAATNVKQIQGNHTPITMLVGFVALLAIAIAVCAIASSAVASLTGFTLVAAQTPAVSLAWFGSTVAPLPEQFIGAVRRRRRPGLHGCPQLNAPARQT